MLPLVLQEMETPRALGLAVLAEHNKEVAMRIDNQPLPGVQLHLLDDRHYCLQRGLREELEAALW